MPTSSYWSPKEKELNRLRKEQERLNKELVILKQRDILKQEIKRAKKEKFYRSPTGKLYLGTASAIGGIKKEMEKPETKKATSKLMKDIEKAWKKL